MCGEVTLRDTAQQDLSLASNRDRFLYFKVQVDHRYMTIPEYLCRSLKIGVGIWITLLLPPLTVHSNFLMSSQVDLHRSLVMPLNVFYTGLFDKSLVKDLVCGYF